MWIYLLFSLLSFAREHDPAGPGPGRPPRCHYQQMKSCEEEHRRARVHSLATASRLENEIRLLSEESRGHQSAQADLQKIAAALAENERMAKLEEEHLTRLISKSAREFRAFSGAPSVEKIFSLPRTAGDWLEILPAERLSRLRRALDSWLEERDALHAREAGILEHIQSLARRISALEASKVSHLEAAQEHGKMCDSGCRERHCPGGNP